MVASVRGWALLVTFGLVAVGALASVPSARAEIPAMGHPDVPAGAARVPAAPCFLGGIGRVPAACGAVAALPERPTAAVAGAASAPPARYDPAMVYDAKDGYLLLFGGLNATSVPLSDTWEYAAGKWTELSPPHHPSARAFASIAYDAKDGYVVLFGGVGENASGGLTMLSDTWTFVGGQWTKLSPATHPVGRYAAVATYDTANKKVVLFGGLSVNFVTGSSTLYGDTWTFVGGTWTRLSPSVHPSPRGADGLAYDPTTGDVVLFGGCGYAAGFCGDPLHDTWEFHSGGWTRLRVTAPTHTFGFVALVENPPNGTLLLYGGADNSTVLGTTWTYSATGWTAWSGSPSPPRMAGEGVAFDPHAGRSGNGEVVLFGGVQPFVPTVYDGAWAFSSGAWLRV